MGLLKGGMSSAFLGVMLTKLLTKIVGLATWIGALAVAIFAALWLLGTDLSAWVFEQFLDIVITLLNTISFNFDALNIAQYIPGLPSEIVNMMGFIGLGQALSIVVAAIALKVLLQLIPFTRLGS